MLDLQPDQTAKKSQGLLTEGLWSERTNGGVVQWDTNLISTGWVTCSLGLKHPDRTPSQSMYSKKKKKKDRKRSMQTHRHISQSSIVATLIEGRHGQA